MDNQIQKMEHEIEALKKQLNELQEEAPNASPQPRFIQPELHAPTGDDALYEAGPVQGMQFDNFENFTGGE
ncbi:hypothetical protein [Effusibacillus consociatus]|uniref:Uncharacterized protein n=1 Tax=Effusibacillus consociatus TaxID=1117041 RepID=A0ABV9Q448_9BACL